MTFATVLEIGFMGAIDFLSQLHVGFILMVGLITGCIGSYTGFRKGHTGYKEKQSARIFKKVSLRLILPLFIVLLIWGINHEPAVSSNVPIIPWIIGGSSLLSLFSVLIIYAITLIRARVEQYLRLYYADLLNPPGKE